MQSPQPWGYYFAGLSPPVPCKPEPCKPATICDANLPLAVSPATLPVVLEESPFEDDPARAMLHRVMCEDMGAPPDEDAASVCSLAPTASEVPNDQMQVGMARWARSKQPPRSIVETEAVCPSIDAACTATMSGSIWLPPDAMEAACPAAPIAVIVVTKAVCQVAPVCFVAPASPDVIVPVIGAKALASTSLRAATLSLTQSAHAAMPKATLRQGLGVLMPSKGKGKSKKR